MNTIAQLGRIAAREMIKRAQNGFAAPEGRFASPMAGAGAPQSGSRIPKAPPPPPPRTTEVPPLYNEPNIPRVSPPEGLGNPRYQQPPTPSHELTHAALGSPGRDTINQLHEYLMNSYPQGRENLPFTPQFPGHLDDEGTPDSYEAPRTPRGSPPNKASGPNWSEAVSRGFGGVFNVRP